MACASQSMLSASSCSFFTNKSQIVFSKPRRPQKKKAGIFSLNASSSSEDSVDCNAEECAPDKEVGKVSMEWLAGDRTQIVGTFPPRKRGWTGYVEKDTAGQTNIYSIEPSVYVAENAISSGTAGTSSEGAENTAAIAAGLALISLAAASSVLIQVYKNEPRIQRVDYTGPPLSYYINKFKPNVPAEAFVLPASETTPSLEPFVPPAPETAPSLEAPVPSESTFSSELQPEVDANSVSVVQLDVETPSVEAFVPPAPETTPTLEAPLPSESTFSSELQPEGDANSVSVVQLDVETPDVHSVS